MSLTHLSRHPIESLRSIPLSDQPSLFKPMGFWYSVDYSWEQWCVTEGMNWLHENIYFVDLGTTNLLKLDSVENILDFSSTYGKPWPYPDSSFMGIRQIDWTKVCRTYDGIEIAPYQWGLRYDMRVNWYYSWDVASGCIWNCENVTIIKATEEQMLEMKNNRALVAP